MNKEYFEKFKEVESNPVEDSTPLADRLSFGNGEIFIDNDLAFRVPGGEKQTNLLLVRHHEDSWLGPGSATVYVGTGGCCHGHVYELHYRKGEKVLECSQIVAADTCVRDMLPVVVDYEKTGFPNDHSGVLVTGIGCAGAGVRLLDMSYSGRIDVITSKEYYNLKRGNVTPLPRFNIKGGKILLELLNLHHLWLEDSKDITSTLEGCGVRIDETIKLQEKYERLRR
jgi:hypothetical protein